MNPPTFSCVRCEDKDAERCASARCEESWYMENCKRTCGACTAECTDTPRWTNGNRKSCDDYAELWCSNGDYREGFRFTTGQKYNYPEHNCCVCGKQGKVCQAPLQIAHVDERGSCAEGATAEH